MKCTQCGTVASPGTNNCPECGTPIGTSTSDVPSNYPSSISKDRKLSVVWVWLGGIAVIGAYAALLIPAFAGQIGDAQTGLGVIFWSSIFFLLLWKYRGRKGWHGSLLGFVVGLVLFTAAPVIVGYQRAAEKSRPETLEHIVDQIEGFYDAANQINADGTLKLVDKTYSPSADASGSLAVVEQFVGKIMNRSAALTNEYFSELNSIGWHMTLDFDRLQTDGSLEESRRLVAEARIAISKHENRTDQLLSDIPNMIQAIDLPAAEKKKFERAFMKSMQSRKPAIERLMTLEKATIDEVEKIIDLLADDPQAWSIDNSELLFESQQQIDQYNEHLDNIDSFLAEQVEIQNAALERARKTIDEFK